MTSTSVCISLRKYPYLDVYDLRQYESWMRLLLWAAALYMKTHMCAAKVMGLLRKRLQKDKNTSTPTVPEEPWNNNVKSNNPRLVVYVPGMPNTEPSSDTIRFNPAAQLPPSIPISDDGEGGYIPQTALRSVYDEELRRPFVPAPNRTAYEGESPPPYRSRSVGQLDHRGDSGWSQRNDYHEHATSRRTCSMSSNKNSGKAVAPTTAGSVTTASSTSPLLGSSRSTCTSSPLPAFFHHTHPPASSCRSPQVRTQRSMAAVPRAVCPIQPGPTDYQQPARAAPAPTPRSTSPSELPQEPCHDPDSLGPPPDYSQAVATARTQDL